jgi:hypothetical protein
VSTPPSTALPARQVPYYFLTPVWGASYTKLFVDFAIPAQLAAGNLPAFAGNPLNKYIIFTRPQDAEAIRAAPAFEKLAATIAVEFDYIAHKIEVPHDTMSDCFRKGIVAAERSNAGLIFLTPDLVFADGSLQTLRRLSSLGHDVVFVPGIRTLKRGVCARLTRDHATGSTISVPPRALMQIALENLHPLAHSSWWDEGEGDLIPANLYWRVGEGGILGRCFHLHPLLVHPQRANARFFGTVDDDYFCAACPDSSRDFVVTNSDDLLAIELSEPEHFFRTGFRKDCVDDAVTWAEQFTNARHRQLFQHVIKMHTGLASPADWARVEAKADAVARQIQARLQLSTWRLLLTCNRALAPRLLRLGQDQRLAAANGLRGHGDADRGPLALLKHSIESLPGRLLARVDQLRRPLRNLVRASQRAAVGTPDAPRRWTYNHDYAARLRRALLPFLVGSREVALLSPTSPRTALLRAILSEQQILVHEVLPVVDGARVSLVRADDYHTVATHSAAVLIVDGALSAAPRGQALKAEIARVLSAGGQLIVLAQHIAHGPADPMVANVECVIDWLRPEFAPLSSRKQGASASWLCAAGAHWLRKKLSSRTLTRRLLALASVVLLPLWLLSAIVLGLLVRALDRLDRTGRAYVSSLVVARRAAAG